MRVKLDQKTHVKMAVLIITRDKHPSRSQLDFVRISANMRYIPGQYFSLIQGKFKQVIWEAKRHPSVRVHLLERLVPRPQDKTTTKVAYSKLYREYAIVVSQRSNSADFSQLEDFLLHFEHDDIGDEYARKILQHNNGRVHISPSQSHEIFDHYGFELNYLEFDRLYYTMDRKKVHSVRSWEGDHRIAANIALEEPIATGLIAAAPEYYRMFLPQMESALIITDQPFRYTASEEDIISYEDIGFNVFHMITRYFAAFYGFFELLQIIYEPSPNKYRSDPFYMHLVTDEILTRMEPEDLLHLNLRELFLEESIQIWQVLSRRDVKQVLQTHYHAPFDLDFFNEHSFDQLKEKGLKIIDVGGLPQNEMIAITFFFLTLKKHGVMQSTIVTDIFRYLVKTRKYDRLDRLLERIDITGNYFVLDNFERHHMIAIPYSHLLLDLSHISDARFKESLGLYQNEGLFFADHYHNLTPVIDPVEHEPQELKAPLSDNFDIDPMYDPRAKDIYEEEMLEHEGIVDADFVEIFEDFTEKFENNLLRTTPILAVMTEYRAYSKEEIEQELDTTRDISSDLEYLDRVNLISANHTQAGSEYSSVHTGRRRISGLLTRINEALSDMVTDLNEVSPMMSLLDLQMSFVNPEYTKDDLMTIAYLVFERVQRIIPEIESQSPHYYALGFVDAVLAMKEADPEERFELTDALRLLISRVDFYLNMQDEALLEEVSFAMEERRLMDKEVHMDEILEEIQQRDTVTEEVDRGISETEKPDGSDTQDLEEDGSQYTEIISKNVDEQPSDPITVDDNDDAIEETVEVKVTDETDNIKEIKESEESEVTTESEHDDAINRLVMDSIDRLDKVAQPLSAEDLSAGSIDELEDLEDLEELDDLSDEVHEVVISGNSTRVNDIIYHHTTIGTWLPAYSDANYYKLFTEEYSYDTRRTENIVQSLLDHSADDQTIGIDLSLEELFTFLLIEEYYPHDPFYIDMLRSPLMTHDIDRLVELGLLSEVRQNQYVVSSKLDLHVLEPAFEVREDNMVVLLNKLMDDFVHNGFHMKIQNKQLLLSILNFYALNELYLHLIAVHNTKNVPTMVVAFYTQLLLNLQNGVKSDMPAVQFYVHQVRRPHPNLNIAIDDENDDEVKDKEDEGSETDIKDTSSSMLSSMPKPAPKSNGGKKSIVSERTDDIEDSKYENNIDNSEDQTIEELTEDDPEETIAETQDESDNDIEVFVDSHQMGEVDTEIHEVGEDESTKVQDESDDPTTPEVLTRPKEMPIEEIIPHHEKMKEPVMYTRDHSISREVISEIKELSIRAVPEGPAVIFRQIISHLILHITEVNVNAEARVLITTFSRAAAKFNLNTAELFSSFNYILSQWHQQNDASNELVDFLMKKVDEFLSGFSYPTEFVSELSRMISDIR